MSGIQDQEVTGISLPGSSWPLTNYLIKLHSNTFHGLCGLALLLGVKRTEWTQNSSAVTWVEWPQLVAAWSVGSWEGNQSSVNILDAITSCWTLPNTFMEALGKVFLYQPPLVIRTMTVNVIFTCRCSEGIGKKKRVLGRWLHVEVLIVHRTKCFSFVSLGWCHFVGFGDPIRLDNLRTWKPGLWTNLK